MARQRRTGLPTQGIPTQGIPSICLNDGDDKEPQEYPLFELAVLKSLRTPVNKVGLHGRSYVSHSRVYIRLCAQRQRGSTSVTIMVCSNGYLLVRSDDPGKASQMKQIPWFQNPKKEILAIALDPSGRQAVCACRDGSLYVIPVYTVLNQSTAVKHSWKSNDLTEISSSSHRGTPTKIAWWTSSDGRNVGIVGNGNGEIVLIDLGQRKEVKSLWLKEEILSLEIVHHPGLSYLIIQSDMGTQWGLILEKTRRKLNPVERANMDITVAGFEVIHPQNALNILYTQEGHSTFQPYCFHNFMDVVTLSTQSAMDHSFVAAHDYSSNILKIFDSSIDNWLPLHVYRLPPQCSDILLTDRLIFALYNHYSVTVLGIFSSHMSEISDHNHPVNEDALMQKFLLPSGQTPLGIFKCSFPVDYLDGKMAPSDDKPSTSSQPFTETPTEQPGGKTSQILLSNVERHTILEGCVLVTDKAVYQCRPRISPEGLFLDLAMEGGETSLPDNLGISLGLDMNGLYELAANQRLAEGQTILAMRLYNRSECSQLKQVANFVKQGYMEEAISLIRSANVRSNLTTADKRLLADAAIKCYLHQILEGRSDEALMVKFRQYLMDNFDYSEMAAMQIFAEHGMQDLVFEVARARGLVGQALEALLSTGSPELDCEQQCLLINQGFISTMSNAGDNAFLLCMTTQEAVNRLVEKPELMYRYMELFSSFLDDLKLSLLIKLAWLFDPSKTTIKPLLSRAVNTTNTRADMFSSSIDTMTSDESIDSPLDTSQSFPRPSALVEFYLKVLIILNHRMTIKGDSTSLVNFDPSCDSTNEQTRQENVVSLPQQRNALSCGQYHVAMVSEDDVYTWGTAHGGRLGHGDIIPADGRSAPFRVETLHMHRIRVISVACGKEHTMALGEQGRLYSWGTSKWGQLGLGDRTTHTRPMLVQALTGTCCVAIACGQYHSMALTQNQKVFSWGWGVHGQLGHGMVEDQLQPCHITSLDSVKVTQMSAGYCHSLVISATGQVYVFGAGTFGQLGLGKQVIKRNLPTLLDGFEGDEVTMVACGLFHNIAVTSNPQKVYMWGKSPLELRQSLQASRKRRTARDSGDSVIVGRRRSVTVMETRPDAYDENQYLRPYAFDFGQIQAPIKQLACSLNHNLILTSGGQLYSFGKNDSGQLGLGHRAEQRVPVLVRLSESQSIAAVGAGVEFSVAITTQGQVYSWGSPENGQLGIDTSCRSHLQIQPSFHVNMRVAKCTSVTRIVLNPLLVPGIPLVTMASGLGMNDGGEESDEDDMGSSDEEEGILDWDLPNLSTTSDPSECPYGPESLALSLQALDSHYNHQVVLRLCQDWQVWSAAAQICELDKNYPLALLYRLKDRQCKGTVIIGAGEEGVLQEITALVDKFIRLTCEKPSNEAAKEPAANESCKHLLVQILRFWAEQDLPQEVLEGVLRDHLDKVAYPLSVLLLCDSSAAPDVSSTRIVSQDLIKRFTSKFTLELTSTVIQGIHQGESHDEYRLPSTIDQETPSENNVVDSVKPLLTRSDAYNQKSDRATAERLWQEILFNLGKDIKARAHVGISKSEIAGLVDSNPSEENVYENNEDCLVFTCGHHYRKRNLQENIMPLWNSKMADLPVPLPSNAQSLSNQYMAGEGFIPIACPNCVHSSLQLEQLKQLDKVV
ncbi:uncharacterized protein [Asterias amurensis]|uniref:uncharacterized protein isoform X3 n=1 Tax=Asterias amurensis TaxID=7602 RepID=UPI003AB6BAFB